MPNMSYMTYLTCMVLWHTPYVCMLIWVSKEALECSQQYYIFYKIVFTAKHWNILIPHFSLYFSEFPLYISLNLWSVETLSKSKKEKFPILVMPQSLNTCKGLIFRWKMKFSHPLNVQLTNKEAKCEFEQFNKNYFLYELCSILLSTWDFPNIFYNCLKVLLNV